MMMMMVVVNRWTSTMVVAGATCPMVDVGQVKLSHRDVLVFLNGVVVTRPDVDDLLFCVAIYTLN